MEREEASEPEKLPVTAYGLFENEEEARKIYGIFKNAMERIPKKGLDLDPCIFPWYRVTMSRSDLAARMCVIAWMLQDETYLDEAAALLPGSFPLPRLSYTPGWGWPEKRTGELRLPCGSS